MKLNAWAAGLLMVFSGWSMGSAGAQTALRDVTFGTNWLAQGEHGGY